MRGIHRVFRVVALVIVLACILPFSSAAKIVAADSAQPRATLTPSDIVVDDENVYFDLNVGAGDFVAVKWKGGSNAQLCDQYWNPVQYGGPTSLYAGYPYDSVYWRDWVLQSYSMTSNSCQVVLSHPLAGVKTLSIQWGPQGLFVDVEFPTSLTSVPWICGHWEPGGDNLDGNDYGTAYGPNGSTPSRFLVTYTGYYSTLWSGNGQACSLQDMDFDEVIGYVYDDEIPFFVGTGDSCDGPYASFPSGQVSFQFMVTSTSEFENRLRPWDLDQDAKVDYKDLAMLGAAYGTTAGQALFNPAADIDQNGKVDYKDLAILGAHYGEVY